MAVEARTPAGGRAVRERVVAVAVTPRRVVCDWCSKNICITSNDDLFYKHNYTSAAFPHLVKKCPHSGKDSTRYGRKP